MVVLVWIVLCIGIGKLHYNRGHSFLGAFFVSLILSPLVGGLLVFLSRKDQAAVDAHAIASGEMKKCVQCAELIRAEALKCRFCGGTVG